MSRPDSEVGAEIQTIHSRRQFPDDDIDHGPHILTWHTPCFVLALRLHHVLSRFPRSTAIATINRATFAAEPETLHLE